MAQDPQVPTGTSDTPPARMASPSQRGVPTDPSSLQAILTGFEEEGFTGQFTVRPDARLHCTACGQDSPAADAHVEALRRMEGASDPADELAVAAVRCPACGSRGTAVLGYGPEAGPDDATVLRVIADDRHGPGIEP